MTWIKQRSASFSLFMLALSACTRGDTAMTAVRTDSTGIEIVQSQADDRALDWSFKEVASIASDDAVANGPGAFDPNDALLRADSAGRLYLMDAAGFRVLVFGADGKFQHALGRKGGGPGEIGYPLMFAVAADGTTSIFDIAKHRLVKFGPDGTVLPESEMGPGFFGGKIHSTGTDFIYDYQGRSDAGGTSGLYQATAGRGTVLIETPNAPTKPIELPSCGMSFSGLPPLLTPTYRWDARGNRIALARDAVYDIALYDGSKMVRRLRREIAPRATTPELAIQEVGEGMRVGTEGGVRVCKPDEVVQQRGFATTIPTIGRIAITPAGELWVRRGGVKGEEQPIDVFGRDGAYQGTLPAQTPFAAAFLSDDRFATVIKDELDVGRIVIYEIKR